MPTFKDDVEKWRWLRAAPAHDMTEPEVRSLAYLLHQAAGHDPRVFCELAHAYVRDCIDYETDTARVGREAIDDHLGPMLARRVDDCDGKARLFVALCKCAGLRARMVDHWSEDGQRLEHVSAAVLLDGRDYPVETILRRARLGERGEDVPKENDGRWLK